MSSSLGLIGLGGCGLTTYPRIDVGLRDAPATPNFEGWNLLGTCQPIDRSLGDFEVVGDFTDGHDGVVSWAGWHGLGRSDDSNGGSAKV